MDDLRDFVVPPKGSSPVLRVVTLGSLAWPILLAGTVFAQSQAPEGDSAPAAGSSDDAPEVAEEEAPAAAEGQSEPAPKDTVEESNDEDERGPSSPSASDQQVASDAPPKRERIEDEDDWVSWPFSRNTERDPGQRWAGVGAFVGWVSRPSDSDSIKYRPGVAYGGYLRPEITSWLGLRLFYREENLPVSVEPGAFDFEGETFDFDFRQPDLQIINLGGRFEPTWTVHPRLRLRAVAGWSWLRMRAPAPVAKGFEIKKTFRAAVQTEITLGAGLSFDVIRDWFDVGVDVAHSLPNSRTGDAYDDQQVIVDGQIRHIAPLPRLEAATDIIFHAGLIL